MTRRRYRRTGRRAATGGSRRNALAAFLCVFLVCIGGQSVAVAATLDDYRTRVQQATEALEELHGAFDETDDVGSKEFLARETETFQRVRDALPASERVEGDGLALDVDNRWLHADLDLYARIAADSRAKRDTMLYGTALRLRALLSQLEEAAIATRAARDKEAEKGRLNSILRRPEYNRQAAEDTAFERFKKRVKDWLSSMMPESRPLNQGTASAFSFVSRLFVFALLAAILIYVLWKYGAQLLPRNRSQKRPKPEARVVLGERLKPGQTPADLIAEAEALARAGDVRGAIRKAYIAVLFELGERNILRLAAHKTNRDYLSALRAAPDAAATLYGDMQPLTHNYERHWYGFAPATDADWHDFRSRCRQLTQ